METVYIDSLFVINLALDYLLLLATGRICSLGLRRRRIAAGAALGAGYSVLVALPKLGFLASPVIKLLFAVGMVLAAYGGKRRLLRCFVVFLAVSAAFGGMVYALSLLGGTAPRSGIFFPLSLRVLLPAFAVGYAALSFVFRRSADRAARKKAAVRVTLHGKSATLSALRDTGNGLYDPISGGAVCVADARALLPLFPDSAEALETPDPVERLRRLSETEEGRGRFRLVPYSALGVSDGLLAAFRPDGVEVDGKSEPALMIALSPGRLSGGGEYDAIL